VELKVFASSWSSGLLRSKRNRLRERPVSKCKSMILSILTEPGNDIAVEPYRYTVGLLKNASRNCYAPLAHGVWRM